MIDSRLARFSKLLFPAMLLCSGLAVAADEIKLELVDQRGAGRFSSMKIDADGNVHVAYSLEDGNTNPLNYAFRDQRLNRWFVMPVAQGAATCSLALDSKQRPHIAFVDFGTASGSKLRYARWDGSRWITQPIPLNSDIIAYYTSIVLDENDNPSISFYEYRGPKESELHIRLRVVRWDGQRWGVRTVDPQEGSGKFNSIAIDSAGNLHLAYANVSSGTEGQRYAFWDGKAWNLDVIESGPDGAGYSTFVTVDKNKQPHIAYSTAVTGLVKYAARKNGKWQIEVVDKIAAVGYPDRNSIVLDEQGRPFVSYYDAARGTLKVAWKDGQRWMTAQIDSNAGFASSLQIYKGALWISYSDQGNSGLKVAHWALPPATLVPPPPPPATEVSRREN